ncbi:MAG TPA: hypothetical protein VG965_04135 [Patescibacteria group bacterium]|nr:hypothetical protein [Patescibacteria group bacterium]
MANESEDLQGISPDARAAYSRWRNDYSPDDESALVSAPLISKDTVENMWGIIDQVREDDEYGSYYAQYWWINATNLAEETFGAFYSTEGDNVFLESVDEWLDRNYPPERHDSVYKKNATTIGMSFVLKAYHIQAPDQEAFVDSVRAIPQPEIDNAFNEFGVKPDSRNSILGRARNSKGVTTAGQYHLKPLIDDFADEFTQFEPEIKDGANAMYHFLESYSDVVFNNPQE